MKWYTIVGNALVEFTLYGLVMLAICTLMDFMLKHPTQWTENLIISGSLATLYIGHKLLVKRQYGLFE